MSKKLDAFGSCFTILYMGYNFKICDFFFASLHTNSILKILKFYSKREDFAHNVNGGHIHFDIVISH